MPINIDGLATVIFSLTPIIIMIVMSLNKENALPDLMLSILLLLTTLSCVSILF